MTFASLKLPGTVFAMNNYQTPPFQLLAAHLHGYLYAAIVAEDPEYRGGIGDWCPTDHALFDAVMARVATSAKPQAAAAAMDPAVCRELKARFRAIIRAAGYSSRDAQIRLWFNQGELYASTPTGYDVPPTDVINGALSITKAARVRSKTAHYVRPRHPEARHGGDGDVANTV